MARQPLRARVNWALRWSGSFFALLSLALVVFSYLRQTSAQYRSGHGTRLIVILERGLLRVDRDPTDFVGATLDMSVGPPRPDTSPMPGQSRLTPSLFDLSPGVWVLTVPLWPPTLAMVTLVGVAWLTRVRAGRCPACGYDRSGLPPDAPCPECAIPR